MTDKITWAAFSPLIGGMPSGAELAIGHPPEYAMNIPGFWTNDSLYMYHLNNTRRLDVPYYIIDDSDTDLTKFKQVDVVVACAICAGLSQLNRSNRGADAKQNDHMLNSARFILDNIKPKVLVGENAPALGTAKGKPVADKLKVIAEEFGYSFTIYRTNTALHGIPQHRHRTFYFMWKSPTVPELEWFDSESDDLITFLSKIPKDSLHYNEIVNPNIMSEPNYRFIQYKLGKSDVRHEINEITVTAHAWIVKNNYLDEYIEWLKTNGTERDIIRANHAKEKYSKNMGIWDGSIKPVIDSVNAIISKNIVTTLHPTEDRSLNVRELLALMGMPNDFELVNGKVQTITQNVPTCTAKSMVEQAIKFINGELKLTEYSTLRQNNENQTIEDYDTEKILQKAKSVIKLDIPSLEEHFN